MAAPSGDCAAAGTIRGGIGVARALLAIIAAGAMTVMLGASALSVAIWLLLHAV
jgi:hypothetical protein